MRAVHTLGAAVLGAVLATPLSALALWFLRRDYPVGLGHTWLPAWADYIAGLYVPAVLSGLSGGFLALIGGLTLLRQAHIVWTVSLATAPLLLLMVVGLLVTGSGSLPLDLGLLAAVRLLSTIIGFIMAAFAHHEVSIRK